ncbi:MAG TPA: helix-turn-helix domain-containing protein [Candidatus Binatia bacterium]|nr:helix-turn-helix domain-containing protein [Candidatus Binatia bacterium]
MRGRTRKRIRRSQEERREETRGAVLDATVECLASRGYARTTTAAIAHRAGVSRGALLHYYPSKQQLLAAAVEHVFARRTEEFRRAFATLPRDVDHRAAAVDLLWTMFSGPTFQAWLELVVAARSDRKLLEQVAGITTRFGETVDATYHELFPVPEDPGPFFGLAPRFVFALLQGLALERVVIGDAPRVAELLDVVKALAPLALPAEAAAAIPEPIERRSQ